MEGIDQGNRRVAAGWEDCLKLTRWNGPAGERGLFRSPDVTIMKDLTVQKVINVLFTLGYGRWPADQRLENMLRALQAARVDILVDIRHSPCPSNTNPKSNYGPRDWHLLADGAGLDGHLRPTGIDYIWLGELGNPQKTDSRMEILRGHLASPETAWPVNRGLLLLEGLVDAGKTCCLLCACKDYDLCHRKLIAETLRQRFYGDELKIKDLAE